MDKTEELISAAEVFWKSGDTSRALQAAEQALEISNCPAKKTALSIFIARAHSKKGNYAKSNELLRSIINENIYLPPIILTICYNNLKLDEMEKSLRNTGLVKIFIDKPE